MLFKRKDKSLPKRKPQKNWITRLIENWEAPPWIQPRPVWQSNQYFHALRDRLDYLKDINIRESLYRDRETGQLWRLCDIEGGGDMYPGTVECFEPVKDT